MIYFDSSSSSWKKPRIVIKKTIKAIKHYGFNIGRGSYTNSINCALIVQELRNEIHQFFCNDSTNNVIITKSCTEAINLALKGSAVQNGNIITSCFEHNSVLRTLEYLKKNYNISVTYIEPDKNGIINPNKVLSKINDNTYMVVINHISNVTGATQNIGQIGKICKYKKLLFLVDGAQSCGKEIINLKKHNINFLAVAGHKGLYSLQGIGLLVCNNVKKLKPLICGGTGSKTFNLSQPTDKPDGLEAGTQSVHLIYSLLYGVKFVKRKFNNINKKISTLSHYFIDKLNGINSNKIFKVYCHNINHGIISLYFNNYDSSLIADDLNTFNICVRGGYHCAPLCHKFLKTQDRGLVRISLNYYNTKRQINYFIKKLKKIISSK